MRLHLAPSRLNAYLVGVAAPSAMTAVMILLTHYLSIPNISLLYVPAILFTAVYFGVGPSLVAATVAVIEFDFFLLAPVYTLTIARAEDALAFVTFVIVALLTSQLAAVARAREDERRARMVLQESDRLKSGLLNAVSHDLRTPLASIKGAASALILPDGNLAARDRTDLLQTINEEADRLNRLVSNLLDLSRIEAGALRPVLDWYDIHEVVDTVLPRLRALVGGRPLRVDIRYNGPAIRIDLLRIEQLLFNLVENAAKYTPRGSPIELAACNSPEGIALAVIDHGPGIPEQQRARLFRSFQRGREHSDRHPGTGLGLAICRGIAEAHGGNIRVEDTPGGGATFVVTLPQPVAVPEPAQ
jgi:two-component system sensor histidine kinase KdpD